MVEYVYAREPLCLRDGLHFQNLSFSFIDDKLKSTFAECGNDTSDRIIADREHCPAYKLNGDQGRIHSSLKLQFEFFHELFCKRVIELP